MIAIRTDASPNRGLGHLKRCIAIAKGLPELPLFLIREEESKKPLEAEKLPYFFLREDDQSQKQATEILSKAKDIQLLLIDLYDLKPEFYQTLAKAPFKCVAIDDFHEKEKLPLHSVIHFGLSAEISSFIKGSAVGLHYFPLRSEIQNFAIAEKNFPEIASKFLITTGGSDPKGLSLKIAQLLIKERTLDEVVILQGPFFESDLIQQLQALTKESKKIKIISNSANPAEIFSQADLAISAAGTSSIELAYLGTPLLVLVTAENQLENADGLSNRNCALKYDCRRDFDADEFLSIFHKLQRSPDERRKMSTNSRKLIDGKGGARIAEYLFGLTG